METKIISLSTQRQEGLQLAATLLKEGHLVAFPTETVYGLGADGLNGPAVRNIYLVKGRPLDNPSILHVASKQQALRLWSEVPESAHTLMDTFWPGPLTIILKKSDIIPPEVTGGLDTVAVRMPSDENAREMIRLADVPVAAPSANLSGKPSPTTCRHVTEDLYGRVPLILDGGDCRYGVESTVISLVDGPVVLRPGIISPEMLAMALKTPVAVSSSVLNPLKSGEVAASPGMKYKHYSPNADVIVVLGDPGNAAEKISSLYEEAENNGKKPAIAATEQTKSFYKTKTYAILGDREHPETMCASLFRTLRNLDETADTIFAEGIPAEAAGLAFMNRLLRAAGFHVIQA